MYVCANATTLQIPCTCYLVIKRILSYLILLFIAKEFENMREMLDLCGETVTYDSKLLRKVVMASE